MFYKRNTKMFKQKHLIKFMDCDPAGILFFAKVFYFAHNTYEEFLNQYDLYEIVFNNPSLAFPIVKSNAQYYKPINKGDEIAIEQSIKNIGEHSYTTVYFFKNGDEKLAEVELVHVCVSKSDFKKTKLPERLRKNITSSPDQLF